MVKTFLHTDKDYYYPGEKIWYKAYQRHPAAQLKDSLSKVLHIELINPEKKVIKNEILKIENGVAWGDLSLPDSLVQGTYYLRAYTRWEMNFGEEYISLKPIPILSTEQNLLQEGTNMKRSDKLHVTVNASNNVYNPREKITLKINGADSIGETADLPAKYRVVVERSFRQEDTHLCRANCRGERGISRRDLRGKS